MRDGDKNDAILEVVDFVGMSQLHIDKAFKRWGDPEAAKRGLKKRVYGGHGNGGKFYMRQMFSTSHFVTYKDGYLNIFGFNEKKKYGFAEGFKAKRVEPSKAIKIAGISDIFFPDEGAFFVGEEFGRAIREAPRPAGRGAEHTISEGVERSEVGLVIYGSVAQKGEEIWGNPRLLPLQIGAEHLKGYLKGQNDQEFAIKYVRATSAR